MKPSLALAATAFLLAPTGLQAFEIGFDWGPLELCTSGIPNIVDNPTFTLSDVPEGTRFIRFDLVDLDVPSYDHGGGTVGWNGQNKIAPGAFRYQSPCPPDGRHRYEWTATALDGENGNALGQTSAEKLYP
jgi:phosphatidylethanolamine-binding protein (PEBP) family uncharacterized protein